MVLKDRNFSDGFSASLFTVGTKLKETCCIF